MFKTSPAAGKRRPFWKGLLPRLIAYPVIGYVGIMIAMLAMEGQLLYQPSRASAYWVEPPASLTIEEVHLVAADGTPIHAWWCPRPGARHTVLFCHGSGGNLSCLAGLIPILQEELDASVLLFDYPGFGRSGGTPSEQGCYAAADAAYAWLTQTRQVPAERVVLFGHSLGGGVAVDLATRRPHAALVLVSTFTSIPDMAQQAYPWLPGRWLVRNRFDNLEKIGRCPRPVLIAHGTDDRLIPFAQAERLYTAAGPGKRFLALEGVGHGPIPANVFHAIRTMLATDPERKPLAA